MRPFILLAAALAASATPVLADQTEGLVLAYDRKAHVIVLTDKTVWSLPSDMAVPGDLGAGDRVLFEYDSAGEDGMTDVTDVTRLSVALPADTDGGS